MTDSGLYAYGVVSQEDISFNTDGVEDASEVYTVDGEALSALVSEIDTLDVEQNEENLRAHTEVLQALLEYDGGRTVVPMQFGMAFADEATVQNVLRGTRPAFTRALREVEDAVELGVKVISQGQGRSTPNGIEAEAEALFDSLARETQELDSFSDRLILNRAYLVDRDDREAFNEAVGTFQDEHSDVLLQYTGPWAPFNFVDINVGATP